MTNYQINYSYKEIGWGSFEMEAVDKDEAEFDALNKIRDENPDLVDIEILDIKEV